MRKILLIRLGGKVPECVFDIYSDLDIQVHFANERSNLKKLVYSQKELEKIKNDEIILFNLLRSSLSK